MLLDIDRCSLHGFLLDYVRGELGSIVALYFAGTTSKIPEVVDQHGRNVLCFPNGPSFCGAAPSPTHSANDSNIMVASVTFIVRIYV